MMAGSNSSAPDPPDTDGSRTVAGALTTPHPDLLVLPSSTIGGRRATAVAAELREDGDRRRIAEPSTPRPSLHSPPPSYGGGGGPATDGSTEEVGADPPGDADRRSVADSSDSPSVAADGGGGEKDSASAAANGRRLKIQKSSSYLGVTKHRSSGKFESHIWDRTCKLEGRRRKGKQVYLGCYDSEEKAARAYDVAALKYCGPSTKLNFPVSEYEKQIEEIKNMSQEECVKFLRRKSSCFSRGASAYRGVTRWQKDGRWQARIGLVVGNGIKDIYLGTFSTEKEAAEAYDIAAIKLRGLNAVTNFDISNYQGEDSMPLEHNIETKM